MAPIDCAHEPIFLAFSKTMGPTLALFGAIVAWLANNLISWCAWQIGRSVRRFEAMKALNAEIGAFQDEELYYADRANLEALLQHLKADLGPYKPWTPYVPVFDRTPVFDNLVSGGALPALPGSVLENVVKYYYAASGLNLQLKDFTSETYKQLSHARQQSVILDLQPLAEDTAQARKDVLIAINNYFRWQRLALPAFVVAAGIALLVCAPPLVAASNRLAQAFISAAEWASTCDALLKDNKK
jgi:hypothetical protein